MELREGIETICIGPRFLRGLVMLRTPDSVIGLLRAVDREILGRVTGSAPGSKEQWTPTLYV
jgi:hypothetical protein